MDMRFSLIWRIESQECKAGGLLGGLYRLEAWVECVGDS
jgi:hypothetical protein